MAGAASLGAQIWVFPSDAEPTDWKPAASYVSDRIGDDDIIRTHPPWNVDGLTYLERHGKQIDRKRDPVLGDLYDRETIWILTETATLDGAIDRLPFEAPDPGIERFGDVSVVRTEVPGDVVYQWEALRALDEATVERVDPDGGTETCDNWSEGDRRWDCGGRDRWLYVGEGFKYLGGDPRDAIWAHALPDQKHLRVEFPDVPLGDLLRVRGGFIFAAARKDNGKPVTMRILVDGEERARRSYPILESTWEAIDVDTSDISADTGTVTVVISSPNFKDRRFCFNAWTR